jgi:tetratricopeptide (TPR) repeat protein
MTSLLKSAAVFAVLVTGACSTSGDMSRQEGAGADSLFGAYLKGRYAAESFNIPAAEEAFAEVARRTNAPQSVSTAFGYALAAGDIEEAERHARIIVAGQAGAPFDEDASIQSDLPLLTLATAAMERGQAREAADLLAAEMQSSLGKSLAALLRSAALYAAGDLDGASEVLKTQPQNTFRGLVPQHVAFLYALEGEEDAAEAAFRQALNAPRAETAALGLARFYEETGRSEDAQAIYRTILEDGGLYLRAGRMGLTRLDALSGEQRSFARRARRSEPVADDAASLFALALEGYAWLGFEQAMAIGGGDPRAEQLRRISLVIPLGLANLARHADGARDGSDYLASIIFSLYDTPRAAFQAASDVPPSSPFYTFAVLEQAAAAGEMDAETSADDPAELLRSALSAEPGDPQWAMQLHLYLAEGGRYEESDFYATQAINAAERIGLNERALWRYYFSRGATRVDAGEWPGGRTDLERALELAPDEPLILNYLGYSYVERGEQLERAFAMIERALDIEPQNGAIVDSLGWANFQRGCYDQAVVLLERAVELEPADAVITDHLGDAYYAVGREREAVYEWRRVLELEDADDELRAAARAKLAGDFSRFPVLAGIGNP